MIDARLNLPEPASRPSSARASGRRPEPVLLTEIRAAGHVRQARLERQSNNFTANSVVPGGEAMAKGTTTDFSEQNTESAMQVMDWMRDIMNRA